MNAEAAKELLLRLAEEEMSGNRLSMNYRKSIRRSQVYFFSWMKEMGVSDIREVRKKELCEYQKDLCKEVSKNTGLPLSAGVQKERYRAVCMLFSLLYRHGMAEENPAHGLTLDTAKSGKGTRRAMSREEITHFLESLDVKTAKGIRDRALFELIYSSGLRVGEAAGLKVGDIDIENRQMIVRGKFGSDRMVPLSKVAKDFLVVYLGKRIQYPEEAVFLGRRGPIKAGSISQCFRLLLRDLDMYRADITTHSIRHSTATHLLDNGASIRHVQELLGHRNIETTVRYTHVQTEGLMKVYRKYHPREHALFEMVDEEYLRRLDSVIEGVKETREGSVDR